MICIATIGVGSARAAGDRPRNVAIVPEGHTILSTSAGSTSIVQSHYASAFGFWVDNTLELGMESWGIAMLTSGNYAVVTHPDEDEMTILVRSGPSDTSFEVAPYTLKVPYYCTEVIADPDYAYGCYVVNRGAAPAGAEPWQHAVYYVDVSSLNPNDPITQTFITEREPRALAISPQTASGRFLFVGHVQGAIGGSGIATSIDQSPGNPASLFDGGSIVAFDLATGQAAYRVPVGSPVRDLAILPVASGSVAYRLYFTHVGDGAQSEDPGKGGRTIPNVISNIGLDADHDYVVGSRQDVIFGHDPGYDAYNHSSSEHLDLPAVVPEQLAFRQDPSTSEWDLWISNSASGTISRAGIDAQGLVEVQLDGGSPDLLSIIEAANPTGNAFPLPVIDVDARADNAFIEDDEISFLDTSTADNLIATVWYEQVANPYHLLTDPGSGFVVPFSSRPRGIVWDPANDFLYVVTEFGNEILQISGSTGALTAQESLCLGGCNVIPVDERNFFTFGRGFDFRESGPTSRVNNLSCGSCHVDGHLDGKVRLTLLLTELGPVGGTKPNHKAVAVPSIFDTGETDWLFFNGLTTIRDGAKFLVGVGCNYCQDRDFFQNTPLFTVAAESPISPHLPSGQLDPAGPELWGRSHFESMNCNRCHASGTGSTFKRTNEPTSELPDASESMIGIAVSPNGPLPLSQVSGSRMLHDPTQSFITKADFDGVNAFNDFISERNKTDVGTRTPGEVKFNGINTPSLAGAWDNAPYMHDGRYRSLAEVLANTWLDPSDFLAAPLSAGMPPDNAFDSLDLHAAPPSLETGFDELFAFGTHEDGAGGLSVAAHLGSTATDELIAFINAASSQTDLCDGTGPVEIVAGSFQESKQGNTVTLSWDTSVPISSTGEWRKLPSGTWQPFSTAVGFSHSYPVQVQGQNVYEIRIHVESTLCSLEDPGEFTDEQVFQFNDGSSKSTPLARYSLSAAPNPFNPATSIQYGVTVPGKVWVAVYDLRGRLVRTLVSEDKPVGEYAVSWNGRDEKGDPAASGSYFLLLQSASGTRHFRVTLLK